MDSNTQKKQFTELYDEEADSVYRFCFLRTSDNEVARDLMQDTFVRFWDVLCRGDEIHNSRAFLFTIARNRIIDWYRKKKTLSLELLEGKSGADGERFADTASRESIEMTHEATYLMEQLREIDPLYQQVVYFRFVEDLGPKEIALILGESANVISVRIHRGLAQLRKVAGYHEK